MTGITTYVVLALYYRKPLRATVAPLEDVDPKTLLVDRCVGRGPLLRAFRCVSKAKRQAAGGCVNIHAMED